MTPSISTSELSALQSLPWSGKPVYFDADRLPNAPRAFEAWITESTPRLRAIYDQHKKELNELRLVIRSVDGVDYLMSIDSPASLLRRHSALSCSRSATSSITVPAPAGCNYLPFQLAGIEYARQHGNILIGDEMGLGKTVQALGIFNDNASYRTMLIICPAYLKLNWRNEAQKWLVRPATFTLVEGRKFAYPKGVTGVHVAIINYDILHDHLEWINGQHFDLVVMDECFIAGTPVLTLTGWKPIEQVQVGDSVLSLDFSCNELEWKHVTKTYLNPMRGRRLVTIKHEQGEFTCTEEHRIATARGYKRAIEVTSEDCLLSLPNRLLQTISSKCHSSILRNKLFSQMENVSARSSTQGKQDYCKGSDGEPWTNPTRCVPSNAPQQPLDYGWSQGENYSVPPRAHVLVKGRQRQAHHSATQTLRSFRRWVGYGASHFNRWLNLWRDMFASLLQGRFSPTLNQTGSRGGWSYPQNEAMEILGPQERVRPQLSRVDSVEVLERGSGPAPHVYCLEVEGNHNFIAGGAVVSNCHYIKTPEARRTKALLDINAKRFVALSGTPAVNRPIELWPIIKRLQGKKALGYWAFATTYCDLKVTPWGKDVSGCSNPVALRNWLRANLMVRRLKADVLTELPAKMRQVIELPPSTAIKNVVDMENQKFAPHESTIIALKEKMDAAEISDDDTTFHACASAIAKEIQMGMFEIAKERSRLSELKAPLIAAHVESCLSADPSMKIIVFTHHREAASIITTALAEYGAVTIHGGVSPDDRQAICARFQSVPECRVIVGTMGAMGVGLTLTASSRVIFVELDWRPGIMAQAEDRAHRIGQLESVLCQYFIFPDSVESKMIGSILEKMENLSQILDQGGRENDDAPKKTRAKSAGPSLEAFSQKITNEVKKLVLRGLKILAKMDADRATRQDAKGFSKWDSPIGHRLASSEALTTREAAFGLRLIHRYRRQIPDIAQDLDVADKPKGTTLVK